ncbi:MAG: DNA cytosine methyltransferase [Acidobacteriaceae bacterium]|nr:DNA cytosine methyltransferase [Acidobacteriaceae bacterium]
MPLRFLEFFAGGGMARAGLGEAWRCVFANDNDAKKRASYAANWGHEHLNPSSVADLTMADLPERADLAWASFPCQDLSLAGDYAGLEGERSGTFWPFWRVIKALVKEERAPSLVVLENVCGALTSHRGKDFAAIGAALTRSGYRFGALVMDAVHFLPQSRPRLFILALRKGGNIPDDLTTAQPVPIWHSPALVGAYENLTTRSKAAWLWWKVPEPLPRATVFSDFIEDKPEGVVWHTAAETERLLSLMSPLNRRKVENAKGTGRRMVGGIYKRTRPDGDGGRVQRAEIRFDDIAGCLRTPVGGSSRQSIMIVEGDHIRSRLLSPREAARLMGLPDTYKLPTNYNDAYHLVGDGVAVPVVRHLARNIIEPLIRNTQAMVEPAA